MSKPSAVDMETVVYTEKETSKAAEESMKCKERYSVTHTHACTHAGTHTHLQTEVSRTRILCPVLVWRG